MNPEKPDESSIQEKMKSFLNLFTKKIDRNTSNIKENLRRYVEEVRNAQFSEEFGRMLDSYITTMPSDTKGFRKTGFSGMTSYQEAGETINKWDSSPLSDHDKECFDALILHVIEEDFLRQAQDQIEEIANQMAENKNDDPNLK